MASSRRDENWKGLPLLSKMEAALAAESCSEVGRASSWLEAVEVEVCVADMFAEAAKSMITAGVRALASE